MSITKNSTVFYKFLEQQNYDSEFIRTAVSKMSVLRFQIVSTKEPLLEQKGKQVRLNWIERKALWGWFGKAAEEAVRKSLKDSR